MPASLALTPPEALRLWLKDFAGQKIVVGDSVEGWVTSGLTPAQAAQAARSLSEGQGARARSSTSAWTFVAYVFAALFAVQVVFVAIMLVISLLINVNY